MAAFQGIIFPSPGYLPLALAPSTVQLVTASRQGKPLRVSKHVVTSVHTGTARKHKPAIAETRGFIAQSNASPTLTRRSGWASSDPLQGTRFVTSNATLN
ncbi:hypothetical protein RRG08_031175 [Elysia crispata]|uniref:Uncharacterized protein n=1 Tax=Elysia crispata TaxID=231223 RepID=A0AAE0ZHC2_9GAST|nr:hypothetical protein RRG08_031175 [Elysia crispata]